MKTQSKIIVAVISGLILGAISFSAKAIIDVEVLKNENKNVKELVIEVKEDVKEIRNYLIH